jgi:hypothetical protein
MLKRLTVSSMSLQLNVRLASTVSSVPHDFTQRTTITTHTCTMSASQFVWYNPTCGSRHKSFVTEKGYTMHFELSPSCLTFFRQSSAGINSKRSPPNEFDTVFSSTKRKALLRRDMTNPHPNTSRDVMASTLADAPSIDDTINLMDTSAAAPANVDDVDDDDFAAADVGYIWEQEVNGAAAPTVPDATAEPWLFSNEQMWTIALLKLLDDMHAPDYAYASVLRWARGANAAGYSF